MYIDPNPQKRESIYVREGQKKTAKKLQFLTFWGFPKGFFIDMKKDVKMFF